MGAAALATRISVVLAELLSAACNEGVGARGRLGDRRSGAGALVVPGLPARTGCGWEDGMFASRMSCEVLWGCQEQSRASSQPALP